MPQRDYLATPNADKWEQAPGSLPVPLEIIENAAQDFQGLLNALDAKGFDIPIKDLELRDALVYDGLPLTDGVTTQFMFSFADRDIILPKVDVHGWTPEILSNGVFAPGTGNAVAFEDSGLRTGLWLHSGYGETAGMLQRYLELNKDGYRHEIWTVDEVLKTKIVGARVFIQQSDSMRNAKIVAAARVPPDGVIEIAAHVMDLVPYIIENYPDHGFEEIADRSDVLMLYFCGRVLTGEDAHPDLPSYQQSRFILAMVPDD
ncbi:MAG: hypothetical protein ACYTF1_25150 [Planctomycetota bacterium]